MIFEEYEYFDYTFPEPRYLGAKHTHLLMLRIRPKIRCELMPIHHCPK